MIQKLFQTEGESNLRASCLIILNKIYEYASKQLAILDGFQCLIQVLETQLYS